ncbi:MAG: hypothetical protein HWN68_03995 [Desulfobacterales bacterium]|nr:hypothetical protein [Desulfobacterales bacterium]
MDDNSIQYKGFIIAAHPKLLEGLERWSIEITIARDTGGEPSTRDFSARGTYETREEALEECFNFGRRIIDGKVLGCNVHGL